MSFTETIAAARAFGAPGEPRPVPNQELLAVGLANVAGRIRSVPCRPGAVRHRRRSIAPPARARKWPNSSPPRPPSATLLLLAPLIALMPQCRAGSGGGGLFRGSDQARRIPRHPPRAPDRISLGGHCFRRSRSTGHPEGNPRRSDSPRCLRWRNRRTARRSTSWAASAARTCSGRARMNIRTTRAGPDC